MYALCLWYFWVRKAAYILYSQPKSACPACHCLS